MQPNPARGSGQEDEGGPDHVSPNPPPAAKGIARSLGEFFGHVIKAVKTDPSRQSTRRESHTEEVRDTAQGKVILRRTVIEEVEMQRPTSQSPQRDGGSGDPSPPPPATPKR